MPEPQSNDLAEANRMLKVLWRDYRGMCAGRLIWMIIASAGWLGLAVYTVI